ncbi:MAG: MnhB domain-containing protein [Cocleimonas sp.]
MKFSPILDITLRWLVVLLGIVSFFLLLRGHDQPGGGFSGGLLAASAVTIITITYGTDAGRKFLHFQPLSYIATGLLFASLAGLFQWNAPYMSSIWIKLPIGFTTLKLGTPLLFDLGVYVVVLGVISLFVLELESVMNKPEHKKGKEEL